MSLRSATEADIANVFLNEDDFAERHHVEGKEIACVISTDDALPMVGGYALGVASDSLLLFAAEGDLKRKGSGESLNVDGTEYIINRWSNQMGMHVITINATVGV